jgi:hypothetical protein
MEKDDSEKKKEQTAPSVSELEADVAYFDARLSMLGQPSTQYQKAQVKAYQVLEGMLVQSLVRVRGRLLTLGDAEQQPAEAEEKGAKGPKK